jgi:hypothetical protein
VICSPAARSPIYIYVPIPGYPEIVPTPGTKRRTLLEENAGAVQVNLTGSDLRRIEGVAPKGVAAGARYPEAGMRTIDTP